LVVAENEALEMVVGKIEPGFFQRQSPGQPCVSPWLNDGSRLALEMMLLGISSMLKYSWNPYASMIKIRPHDAELRSGPYSK
jgi:hypothetical protein